MTYKSRIINRDIYSPPVEVKGYILSGQSWVYYGSEYWGEGQGSSSAIRNWLERGWETIPGWKALRDANGYLNTNQMDERSYRHDQLSCTNIVMMRYGPQNFRVEVPQFRQQIKDCSQLASYIAGLGDDPSVKHKVLAKVRDGKVNLGVTFGEGRQTVNMFADTAHKLGRAYHSFRKGNFKQVAKILGVKKPVGEAANHWLAYNLGWMPLVSDLKGLAELAAQHLELGGRGPRQTFRATNSEKVDVEEIVAYGQGSYYLNGDYLVKGSWKREYKAGLMCEVEYSTSALAAQVGLGLYDPLLLAWELTPFSFVFDYVIDVGTWLSSASSLQGWKVLDGYESLTQTFEGNQYLMNPRCWNLPFEDIEGSTVCKVRQRFYTRRRWTGSVPSISTPLWDGLRGKRLITIGALYKQLTSGDRKPGAYRP